MNPFLNNTVETMTQGYYTLHNVVNNIVIKPVTTTFTCVTNIGATIINYPLRIISTSTPNLTLALPLTLNTNTNTDTSQVQINNIQDHLDETKINTETEQISSGNVTPDELDVNALLSDELDMYIRDAMDNFNDDSKIYWPVIHDPS